jgi:hypothetical protein
VTGPAIHAAAAKAVRAGAPRLRTGTVSTTTTLAAPTVIMTGDTDAVSAAAVSGYLPAAGDVVQVLLQDGAVPLLLGETVARRVACRLRRTANQSIPAGGAGPTLISWDTEDEDPYGFITVASDTITVPAGLPGTYAITVRDTGNFGGRSFGNLTVTSSITGNSGTFRALPDDVTGGFVVVAATIPLAAADTLTFGLFQNSAGSANHTAWINVVRVGP